MSDALRHQWLKYDCIHNLNGKVLTDQKLVQVVQVCIFDISLLIILHSWRTVRLHGMSNFQTENSKFQLF